VLGKVKVAQVARSNMGGGFIEHIFGSNQRRSEQAYAPSYSVPFYAERTSHGGPGYMVDDEDAPRSARPRVLRDDARSLDPRYLPQTVTYDGKEAAGTIIVDTPNRFLFLVEEGGKARRYGIGVGRPGFTWAGVKTVSAKREWPDWRPPDEMLRRRPDLPRYMPGGPDNPLGARALYLGSSLYRIHGSNEPWTIGTAVSSGCIRMRNEDVSDLYSRVSLGTKVVVM
jgi:lipoprotein-anchoring transpeptidase ErfK/SrfK